MSNSKSKLHPSIYYNEDKTMVGVVMTSGNPIAEEEFLAALLDLLTEFSESFAYEDEAKMVELDFEVDEEYDGSRPH